MGAYSRHCLVDHTTARCPIGCSTRPVQTTRACEATEKKNKKKKEVENILSYTCAGGSRERRTNERVACALIELCIALGRFSNTAAVASQQRAVRGCLRLRQRPSRGSSM